MENTTPKPVRLGSIYACIAGDHRYATTITVYVSMDKAYVTTSENGAVGGMDGDGRAHPMEDKATLVCEAMARDIVATVKKAINSEKCHIIKTYGKPSKRFSWVTSDVPGLSIRACQKALDR
jgi:hypothetical protein